MRRGFIDLGRGRQDGAQGAARFQEVEGVTHMAHPVDACKRRVHQHQIMDRIGAQGEEVGAGDTQPVPRNPEQGIGAVRMDFNGIDLRTAREDRADDVADPGRRFEHTHVRGNPQIGQQMIDGLGGRRKEGQIKGNSGAGGAVILGSRGVGGSIGQGRAIIGGQLAVDGLDQIITGEPQVSVAVLEAANLEIAGLNLGLARAVALGTIAAKSDLKLSRPIRGMIEDSEGPLYVVKDCPDTAVTETAVIGENMGQDDPAADLEAVMGLEATVEARKSTGDTAPEDQL